MATNNVILHLETEIHRLTEELQVSRIREEERRNELQMSRAINVQMLRQNHTLSQEKALISEENKKLSKKIELLERRGCDKDCVPCVIASICENMHTYKGVKLCCRQLEKIIILSPGPKIEGEDLKCVHFMNILEGRNIVKKHAEYKYPPQMVDRGDEIVKAWNELMTMNGRHRVVIIGRVNSEANGDSHVELCYLDTRTPDGRVKIHDPQSEMSEQGREGDLQDFINHVKGDGGVIFYTMIWVELITIITKYSPILHVKTSNTTPATVAIEGLQQSVINNEHE